MPASLTEPTLFHHFPPNWDQRPRVEPWNGHLTRESWLEREKEDLVSIIELLNHQLTNANQNALDATYLAEWRIHRVLAEVRIGARIYSHLTRALRKGRKTVRIDELVAAAHLNRGGEP
ncbi:hypothetical protein [Prescottella equi]|uniref:hypothetical protein n=1 Tax=Rhodococcus hoagii TaxID=43767 RepID=UPI00384ED062